MPETLDTAVDSLSDYTRRFEIATFYTNGDAERAKQMIAGAFKDIYVIKGKFNTTTSLCAFILFFNYNTLSLNSVYPVFSHSSVLKDLKTNIDWKIFEKHLTELANSKDNDEVLCRQFKSTFNMAFSLQFAGELKKLLEGRNEIGINRVFTLFAQDRLGFQSVSLTVDCESLTSIDMELNSITSKKIVETRGNKDAETKEGAPEVEIEVDDDSDFVRDKDIRLMLNGSLVLSPVTGRAVNLLIIGDRIKTKILDRHARAIQVAKAFNAYDDDEGIWPVAGRIVSIKRQTGGGYKLFVIVAKGIYVKIYEAEEEIKVAMDTSNVDDKSAAVKTSKVSIIVIVVLSVVLLAMIGLIIYLFK
jgi:hypothetical protein